MDVLHQRDSMKPNWELAWLLHPQRGFQQQKFKLEWKYLKSSVYRVWVGYYVGVIMDISNLAPRIPILTDDAKGCKK
ncbi:hypothetical protein TRIUR3_23439 [Triticum urartu]|uniref:Uncharacterized protein n=1 Tax=Triticum urartu TaxID=4572 RepID=M7YEM9_TRIUA|nr:hypothetical protein TRIUR3_23439 [Triticum urartu]